MDTSMDKITINTMPDLILFRMGGKGEEQKGPTNQPFPCDFYRRRN